MSEMKRIGVLTSGGDSQGMNAAVRSVVRAALHHRREVFAIYEGYEGLVRGGDSIRPMSWDDVGGILHQGGTVIGSARSAEFRTREGRVRAAHNLLEHDIDGLVVIGGDGTLTGADRFRREWPELLAELVSKREIGQDKADRHPHLRIVGLVGSIDNDMFGTDMTIGTDTALHRIIDAVDAIASTAASHHRSFVVEVMGRHCGYLALMAGLATGANWVLIPENPPEEDWESVMCETIQAGRKTGRRHNIVIVAEGALDRQGKPITSTQVKETLSKRLGEDTRVTILGHVQRGGSPSAFDRTMSSILGYAAVEELLSTRPDSEPQLIGIRDNEVSRSPLMENVVKTQQVGERIAAGQYEEAMELRGWSFTRSLTILKTLLRAYPHEPQPERRTLRLAVMHGGGPAPGMNTAVRVAVRIGIDKGHKILGVRNGLAGLLHGQVSSMEWMSVHGWVARGGAELGTSRRLPEAGDYYTIARRIEEHRIDGLLLIGGWDAYELAHRLYSRRSEFPMFRIPIVCVPATINNDLPSTESTIGADTALNTIVDAVDKVKESAVAVRRCFVVEVMGRDCGYLALLGGMATGAEHVYLPEEGIALSKLVEDCAELTAGFERGKRLGLVIANERADAYYTTDFLVTLYEKEGGDRFDVRRCILGHTQQGGTPSPFDRIQATRLTAEAMEHLIEQATAGAVPVVGIGRRSGRVTFTDLDDLPSLLEAGVRRPKRQGWVRLHRVAHALAQRPRLEEKSDERGRPAQERNS